MVSLIFKIRSFINTIWDATFYSSSKNQFAIFILGVFCLSTAYFSNESHVFLITSGVGCSIIASALVLKLSSDKKKDFSKDTGLIFMGDRSTFEAYYGRDVNKKTQITGWDCWIDETPYGGKIIIVGQKNSKWLENSATKIKSALQRNISIQFIFAGPNSIVEEHLTKFKESCTEHNIHISKKLSCWKYIIGSDAEVERDNIGYYWNGKTFIIKLYLPNIDNINCPLLCFKTPGIGFEFDINKFKSNLVLSDGNTINRFATSLSQIMNNIIKYDTR